MKDVGFGIGHVHGFTEGLEAFVELEDFGSEYSACAVFGGGRQGDCEGYEPSQADCGEGGCCQK